MDVTVQDAVNIVTMVVPGYVALRVYSTIYAKKEREFSQLLIESVTFSLLIVAFTSWLWQLINHRPAAPLEFGYILAMLMTSFIFGLLFVFLRSHWPIRPMAERLGFGAADNDFIRGQFRRLDLKHNPDAFVTVTLKNGEIFSGKPTRGSIYFKDAPREYYFSDIAWYDKENGKWDNQPGGLILNLEEVAYIATSNGV